MTTKQTTPSQPSKDAPIRVTVQDGVSPKPAGLMKPSPPPPPPKKK